jgi:hypothetical protein
MISLDAERDAILVSSPPPSSSCSGAPDPPARTTPWEREGRSKKQRLVRRAGGSGTVRCGNVRSPKSWNLSRIVSNGSTGSGGWMSGWMCAHGGGRVRGLLKVGRTGAPNGRVGVGATHWARPSVFFVNCIDL